MSKQRLEDKKIKEYLDYRKNLEKDEKVLKSGFGKCWKKS